MTAFIEASRPSRACERAEDVHVRAKQIALDQQELNPNLLEAELAIPNRKVFQLLKLIEEVAGQVTGWKASFAVNFVISLRLCSIFSRT
ncbi:hypothetical protein [Sinorhizobium meliloti]|uniref:hypothetical protein n=1 Tax=Rhizobium meliloti TaxID=382 RepID=UPI001268967A|nr:hypothetical protein [Sinorhizobium meliloti]